LSHESHKKTFYTHIPPPNMSHLSSHDSISFGQTEHKSFFRRMSPRVIIYPIIVLIIVMLMMKTDKLAKKAEPEKQQEQQQSSPKYDPMKPTALAPLFPQLVFYYEKDFKEKEMMERLNEKYHKVCSIFAVDLLKHPDKMWMPPEQKVPYAVFSKPDGVNIKTQSLMDFEFYDAMLSSMLKPADSSETPAATQPAENPAQEKSAETPQTAQ